MNIAGMKRAPDHFEHSISLIAPTYTTRRVSVHIKKNHISDSGKIELTPGTKVAGTVFNQNNEPIKGAKVATFQFTNHPAITDADGKFEFEDSIPGGNYNLTAAKTGFISIS